MKARTLCIYSDSGEGKSTQGYFLAKWIWKTFGLRTRWISFDGKYDQLLLGQPELDGKSLIDAGVVELWDAANMKTALADVRRFSEGYWPRWNKANGGSWYFRSDPNCETKDWDKIGMVVIDDISSLCESWLVHISDQPGQVGTAKHAWVYDEDEYTIRGVNDSHYGLVQKELTRIVKQGFNQLPVKYVMYMAKVEKGTENYRRKKVKRNDPDANPEPNVTTMYGPKAAGQALTSFMPGWFADCFHIGRVPYDPEKYLKHFGVEGNEVRVAYYDTHLHEQTDVPFMCRVDIRPEDVPKLRSKWKGGAIPLGFDRGLDKFYDFVIELGGKRDG